MALNNMGLGFTVSAKDTSEGVFKKAGDNLETLKSKGEESAASMQEVGGELQKVGATLAAIGAVGVAGLGLATEQAMAFGESISKVSTLIDESKFSTDQVYDLAQKLAMTYGQDQNKEAQALYVAISKGADTAAKAQTILAEANKLSAVTGEDLSQAVTALSAAQNAFAKSGLTAAAASDVLVRAMQLGGGSATEMAEALQRLAPTATTSGISFQELAAALTTMKKEGIESSRGMLALKQVMSDLANPTGALKTVSEQMGVHLSANELKTKGLVGVLEELQKTGKLTAANLRLMFGDGEELNTVMALLANNGMTLADNLNKINGAAGATDEAFKKVSDDFAFQANILKSKFQVALTRMGEVILPMFEKIVDVLSHLMDAFNDLPEPVRTGITWFIAIASVGLILIGALIGLVGTIMAAAGSLEAIAIALGVASGIFEVLAVVVGGGVLAFIAFKQAYEQNLGGFGDFVRETIGKVILTFKALQQLFTDGGFSGDVMTELNKAGNEGIKGFAITVFLWFNRIKYFFTSLIDSFQSVVSTMGPTFEALKTAFHELAKALGFAQDGPDAAKGKFEAFGQAGAQVGAILAKVAGFIVKAITAIIDVATGLVEGFKAAGPVVDMLVAAFGQVWAAVLSIVAAFTDANSAGGGNQSMWRTLGQVVGYVAGAIGKYVADMISVFAFFLRQGAAVVSGLIDYWMGFVSMFKGIINIIKGMVNGDWGQVWLGMKQVVFGVVEQIVAVISAMVEAIAAQFDAIASKVGQDLGLADSVRKAKNAMLGDLKQTMGLNEPQAPAQPAQTAPEGVTAPGAPPPPPGTPGNAAATLPAQTMPAAYPGQGGPAQQAPAPPPTKVDLQNTTQVILDGKKIAEEVSKKLTLDGIRSFGPSPPSPV